MVRECPYPTLHDPPPDTLHDPPPDTLPRGSQVVDDKHQEGYLKSLFFVCSNSFAWILVFVGNSVTGADFHPEIYKPNFTSLACILRSYAPAKFPLPLPPARLFLPMLFPLFTDQ